MNTFAELKKIADFISKDGISLQKQRKISNVHFDEDGYLYFTAENSSGTYARNDGEYRTNGSIVEHKQEVVRTETHIDWVKK